MIKTLSIISVLLPLLGSLLVAGLGRRLGRVFAHWVASGSVALSMLITLIIFIKINVLNESIFEGDVYQWISNSDYRFGVGFLIDSLSSTMMLMVTFVSLMVHIYTIGYMSHDENYSDSNPYYQRFFSYIALFTFAMLILVVSNNFLQLFFGWEAVGLVSYLLIGFYTQKESAVKANLKAFLVNRISDIGLLLGISLIFMYFGTLNYYEFFGLLNDSVTDITISIFGESAWQVVTLIALLLFFGAMGKSAQMPLHVWLPESMEGPTPISALIHAATMVTAGIYMIARLSPLFELSEVALSTILIVGSTTAFFMGILAIVQYDIKRVVAYSTLSQLGYMIAALGASAYVSGFFHVFTHAFFKALLFLGAGSVIVALHHQQDIRKMGGLKKHMPITWICMLIGTFSLVGLPLFSGYYSKDLIIELVSKSLIFGNNYAYILLILSTFVTAFYSFRMLFLVFHGKKSNFVLESTPTESPWVITIPLITLAFFSITIGAFVFSDWALGNFFKDSMAVLSEREVLNSLNISTAIDLVLHAPFVIQTYLILAGIFSAWFLYIKKPELATRLLEKYQNSFKYLYYAYGFDRLYQIVFVNGSNKLGKFFWETLETRVLDKGIIESFATSTVYLSGLMRQSQTGNIYHYVSVMIVALVLLLGWLLYVLN